MIKSAITLFLNNLKQYQQEDISLVKLLSGGYTNCCYYFKTKDKKQYLVRMGSIKINRTHEYEFLKATKIIKQYVYYDFDTGNAIKNWITGHVSSFKECKNLDIFEKILLNIKKIQTINLKDVNKMVVRNFYQFLDIAKVDDKYMNLYKKIIEKYKSLKLVVSHNDIRPSNIIINKKQEVTLIDFEWCSLNNQYWDIANITRELDFDLKQLKKLINKHFKHLDFNILIEMLFAATCFAYQWTFFPPMSKSLNLYRKNTYQIMDKYFRLIIS